MKHFHKLQIASSIIPVISSVLVATITMFTLKRNNAKAKYWAIFYLAFLFTGIVASAIVNVIKGYNILLQIFLVSLVFATLNLCFVNLQITVTSESVVPRKSQKKLTIYLLIALFIITSIVALFFVLKTNDNLSIADINGDNSNQLAIITDEQLLSDSDNYQVFLYSGAKSGDRSDVHGQLEEQDYSNISHTFGKLSGVMTVQATTTESDQIVLDIASEIEFGNLEFAIIVDGNIYRRVNANASEKIIIANAAKKEVIVKVGAESAKGKIHITRDLDR